MDNLIITLLTLNIICSMLSLYTLHKIRSKKKTRPVDSTPLKKLQGPVYNQILHKPTNNRIRVNDDQSYFRSNAWRREQENTAQ